MAASRDFQPKPFFQRYAPKNAIGITSPNCLVVAAMPAASVPNAIKRQELTLSPLANRKNARAACAVKWTSVI